MAMGDLGLPARRWLVVSYWRFGTSYIGPIYKGWAMALQDGTNRLSRNVGDWLPTNAAQCPIKAKISWIQEALTEPNAQLLCHNHCGVYVEIQTVHEQLKVRACVRVVYTKQCDFWGATQQLALQRRVLTDKLLPAHLVNKSPPSIKPQVHFSAHKNAPQIVLIF